MAFLGTAGWNIPAPYAHEFPGMGSHLERYTARLNAAEINSSFYRPHQRKTYERWATNVPDNFRFSVKLPRSISHEHRLRGYSDLLLQFLEQASGLGRKLGVILVQLPPSLAYDSDTAESFFRDLQRHGRTLVACEPRHASWFSPAADGAMKKLRVGRVAADPPRAQSDGAPGGWKGLRYWRLHGTPRIYYSSYASKALQALATKLHPNDWCIFDNTAAFAAIGNALALRDLLTGAVPTQEQNFISRVTEV